MRRANSSGTGLLRLEGSKSSDVVLANNDPRRFMKPFICADGASEAAIRTV